MRSYTRSLRRLLLLTMLPIVLLAGLALSIRPVSAHAAAGHPATTTLPTTFSIPSIVLDNRQNVSSSLLQGARVFNGTQYSVAFTLTDMGLGSGRQCFDAWVTVIHSDQHHNIALHLFCDHLELAANNGIKTLGPTINFSIIQGVAHRFGIVVNGQTVTVYLVPPPGASGSPQVLMTWTMPQSARPATGRSDVLYVAGGVAACWDDFDGQPGVSIPGAA